MFALEILSNIPQNFDKLKYDLRHHPPLLDLLYEAYKYYIENGKEDGIKAMIDYEIIDHFSPRLLLIPGYEKYPELVAIFKDLQILKD